MLKYGMWVFLCEHNGLFKPATALKCRALHHFSLGKNLVVLWNDATDCIVQSSLVRCTYFSRLHCLWWLWNFKAL